MQSPVVSGADTKLINGNSGSVFALAGLLNRENEDPSPRPAAEFSRLKTGWSALMITIHQNHAPPPTAPIWWVPLLWPAFCTALDDPDDPDYATQFHTARRAQGCSAKIVFDVFRELLEASTWSTGRNIRLTNTHLAAATRRTERHVRRATHLLEKFGWIVAHYQGTGGGQNGEYGPNIARLRYATNPILEAARERLTATTSTNGPPCENVHLSVCGPSEARQGLLRGTGSEKNGPLASKDGQIEARAGPGPPRKPGLSPYLTDPPRSPRHRRGLVLPSCGLSAPLPRIRGAAHRQMAERIAEIATGPLRPALGVTARQVALSWAAARGTDPTLGTTTTHDNDDAAHPRGGPGNNSGAGTPQPHSDPETPHQQHQRAQAKAHIRRLLAGRQRPQRPLP